MKIALIMDPGTRKMVFNEKCLKRLANSGEVVVNDGGTDFDSVAPLVPIPKDSYYIALERRALADRKPRPASPPLTDRHIPERTCYGFRNDSRTRTTKAEDTRSYHAAGEKRGEKLFIRIGKNAIKNTELLKTMFAATAFR